MPLIKAVLRKYRPTKDGKNKKVIFISFTESVTELNFMKCCTSLKGLLKSPSDTYLFQLNSSDISTAYTIKLLLRFKNSTEKKVGVVINPNNLEKLSILKLDGYFTLGDSERSVLMNFESSA